MSFLACPATAATSAPYTISCPDQTDQKLVKALAESYPIVFDIDNPIIKRISNLAFLLCYDKPNSQKVITNHGWTALIDKCEKDVRTQENIAPFLQAMYDLNSIQVQNPDQKKAEIERRMHVVLKYAHILDQYKPAANGAAMAVKSQAIASCFYVDIVEVIAQMMKLHFKDADFLIKERARIQVSSGAIFYAAVQNDVVHIVDYTRRKPIGSGVTSKVFFIWEITEATRRVFKELYATSNTLNLLNLEWNALIELHKTKRIGVQEPYINKFATINGRYALLGKYYEGGELFYWLQKPEVTNSMRMTMCIDLFTAYQSFHSETPASAAEVDSKVAAEANNDYFLGDIKPDNTLIHAGKPVFCDWTSAQKMNDAVRKFCSPVSYTEDYLSKRDLLDFADAVATRNSAKFREVAYRIDAFAISLITFIVCVKHPPYACVKVSLPDSKHNWDGRSDFTIPNPDAKPHLIEFDLRGYSKELKDLMGSLVDHDPSKRPSIATALDKLKGISGAA